MRSASQEFINSTNPPFHEMYVTPISGSGFVVTYDDISSFTYKSNGTDSGNMAFGGVSSCTISFSVLNPLRTYTTNMFYGASISVYAKKEISGAGTELVLIGEFKVDTATRSESVINVIANDAMALLDVRFNGVQIPCLVRDVAIAICNQVNRTLSTMIFPNYDLVIAPETNLTEYTCRDILSYVCDIAGSFAIFNSAGELELRWFNPQVINSSILANQIYTFEQHDAESVPTGVVGYLNGVEALGGTSVNPIYLIENNILVLSNTAADYSNAITEIFNQRIAGKNYIPCSLTAVGNCLLEVGDSISCTDEMGNIFTAIISTITMSDNFSMKIESTAPTSKSSSMSGTSSGGGGVTLQTTFTRPFAAIPLTTDEVTICSLSISMTSDAVPLAFFTVSIRCEAACNITFRVYSKTVVLSEYHHTCGIGYQTITGVCPIVGLAVGETIIYLKSFASAQVSGAWETSGTSLSIMGNGFAPPETWNEQFELTDTLSGINIPFEVALITLNTFTESVSTVVTNLPLNISITEQFNSVTPQYTTATITVSTINENALNLTLS